MKLTKMEEALRPAAKRATTTEVKKRKKKRKEKKKSTKGTSTMGKSKSDPTDDLSDILNIKKQRAVSNELDDLIHEQEQIKKKRLNEDGEKKTKKEGKDRGGPSIIETLLASDPDKVKDLSMEDAMKFSMLQGGNGDSSADPLMMMMMNGLNTPKDNGGDMMAEVMKGLIAKVFSDGEKKNNGDNDMMKLMMAQNMQTQQMLMKALIANNNKGNGDSERNTVMKEMLELIRDREKQKESLLMDKMREIEMRASGQDPLAEAKRVMDYFKSFGGGFNQSANPEMMEHERKMKEMEFNQEKELRQEELKDKRVNQVSTMIDKAVGTFADVLSKPTAQAVKSKLDQMSQPQQQGGQIPDIPENERHDEIDLGNLNLEGEMNEQPQPQPQTDGRMPRFNVRESGEEVE